MDRASRLVIGAVLLHIAWGVARIPGKVFGKRLDQIHRHEQRGPARFHLDNRHRSGADVVEFLIDNTPEDAVILWRGDFRGALEFVPPLIQPRLMVRAGTVAVDAEIVFGREVARGSLPDGKLEGAFVVVGHRDRLELTIR